MKFFKNILNKLKFCKNYIKIHINAVIKECIKEFNDYCSYLGRRHFRLNLYYTHYKFIINFHYRNFK